MYADRRLKPTTASPPYSASLTFVPSPRADTAMFMVARLGAYKPGTALHDAVAPALRPRFGGALAFTPKVFVLVSILASAFLCHFVAPNFYKELAPGAGAFPKTDASSACAESRKPTWMKGYVKTICEPMATRASCAKRSEEA